MNSQPTLRSILPHAWLPALLLLAGLLLPPSAHAQDGITFTFDNVRTTSEGVAFDVLASADAGTRLGDTQVYLDYNAAGFGTKVTEDGRITATLGPELADGDLYYAPLLNDNTATRVSLVAEYLGQPDQGLVFSEAPIVLFQVEMQGVPDGEAAAISFHEPLMEGQQFTADYTTPFGDVLAVDVLEIELPVDLPTLLRAEANEAGTVRVSWQAPRAAEGAVFALEHAGEPAGLFERVTTLKAGAGKKDGAYEYQLEGLDFGTHRFRVAQIGADGQQRLSEEVEVTVEMAERFVLDPAYPNPFNPQTTVRFAVREAAPVRVELFNTLGQRVKVLYDGTPESNSYQEVRIDGSDLASGLYFVQMRGAAFVATQQITLMK